MLTLAVQYTPQAEIVTRVPRAFSPGSLRLTPRWCGWFLPPPRPHLVQSCSK